MSESSFDELKLRLSGESAVIINERGIVLFCEVPPIRKPDERALSYNDIFDTKKEIDLLRVTGVAMERPGDMIETDCEFRNEQVHVRAVHTLSPVPRTSVFIAKGRARNRCVSD